MSTFVSLALDETILISMDDTISCRIEAEE
jgi:hypothetical protein